jgi:hypothetical protein
MSFAETSRRGAFLNWRFAVNGIQNSAKLLTAESIVFS